MASKLKKESTVLLSDWQLFTNNGNFNNPLPPHRRLKKRNPYFILEIDPNFVRDRYRITRSRNQSAISTSTRRILSARSINYRRPLRVKPIDLNLDEECEELTVYPSTRLKPNRISTACSQRSNLSAPESWSFSYLHRAVIAIDEQAKKDYDAGRAMNALAAWQNALIFCDQLSHRNQLWPANKAALDEEIAVLKRTYKHHMEEMMKKSRNTQQTNKLTFTVPVRKCTTCETEQLHDQFHERFSNICQHIQRTICNKCIFNKAKFLLNTTNKTEFNCPEPHCTAKFNIKEIAKLCPPVTTSTESIENVNRQSKNQPVERKTEFIWCAHEQCGSGQFHVLNQNTSPIVTCVLCKRQTCATHRVKWHKGMTCNEYNQYQQQQQQQALLDSIKKCPKCRSDIEKSRDSNHVVCSTCRKEYCWECMADYKRIQRNGPSYHTTTCIHYDNNPTNQTSKSSTCTIL